ncbi:MAG: pectinesterase family protein [Verrucomicrobiota bacterium]
MCKSTTCARRHTSKLFILVVLALLAQLAVVPLAPAATLTFDGNTGTTGAQDGSGNWDTTTTDWWNSSTDVAWDNTTPGNAVFGVNSGAAGTITVGSGINVANITNNPAGSGYYTISGNTLTLAGNPTIYVAAGTALQLNSYLAGTGYTLEGGGWLTNNPGANGNTYSGATIIDNGELVVGGNDSRVYLPGDVIVNANGTLMFSSGSATGGILGGNKILILNGGVLYGTSSSKYLPVSKMVMDNGGQMQGLSVTIMTNLDARSGLVGGGKGVGRYVFCTLAKSTAGTLTITNQIYSTGVGYSNVTLNAGLLVLDKSVEKTASKITGPLIFAGGTLILTNGNGTAAGGESKITATTVNPGASVAASWTGAGASAGNGALALAAITRQVGGTLDINTNTGGGWLNSVTTTTANNNGILGGWATLNASDWAVGTTFAPLASGSYDTSPNPTTWLTTDNVSFGASTVEVGGGTNINSLKLTGNATITLDGNLTLASGGLLITGSAAPTITGAGTLLGGSGADLIVQQYSSGDLTIASALANNGTATSLTKSGPGKLIISGSNNMTGTNYLNGGAVEVSSMGKLASGPIIMTSGTLRYTGTDATDTRAIMLNGLGGTFDVSSSSTTLTVSNLSNSDGIQIVNATAGRLMGNLGGLTKIGAGTLKLMGSNYFNGLTVVSNGTLLVNGTNAYDTTTFNAGNVTVYGGTLGGTGMISGPVTVMNGGTIAPGDDPGTLTLATNLTMGTGTTALFEMANSPGVSDELVVQGNLTISSGSTIAINVPGTPLAAGTYKLIQYSGTKSGSFNSLPVIVNGTIDGSYTISDSTPGEIDLVVNNQVVIISQPSGTNTVPGAPFSVSVSAAGTAPLYYQWYYTDTNNISTNLLDGATSASYSVVTSQESDSGYYFVIVTNDYNSVTSLVAYVLIKPTPPVLSGPTNQSVIVGNNATLTATRTAGAPTPDYRWYFGTPPTWTQLTDDGSHIAGSSTLSLTITNVQYPADGGTYSIVASNEAGLYTNSATLTVIVPPTFTTSPTSLTVNAGDTANFYAVATGVPAPTLQWYKNKVLMGGQTSSPLSIANAQGSDIATYSVVASNAAGSATNSATLTVVSTNLAATAFAPTNGATGVCYDTPLYITFNGPISIVNSGKIHIYNVANPVTPVDTIDMGSNTVIISTLNAGLGKYLTNNVQAHSPFQGDSQAFNYFPVIITGATAAIYPHSGVLTSNQTYYVTMDNGVVADTNGAYFAGISDTNAWQFTTKPTGPSDPANLVVAADGSGDFATVQGAVDSIALGNTTPTLINIRNGNYVEIVDIASKNNLTLRGQSRAGTIISYGNNANIAPLGTTHARMSFKVYANDIKLENLTLWNSTPQGGSQAEALTIDTGAQRFILNNCEADSLQDTILANVNSSQGYFYNSTIKGNYDYVWGGGNLFFTNCLLYTVTNIYVTNNFNLTASRTDFGVSNATTHWPNFGGSYTANGIDYVNCQILADSRCSVVSYEDLNGTANGLVSFINCQIDTNKYAITNLSGSFTTNSILSQYIMWEYGNTDTNGNPAALGLTVLTNNDPRLLAAENATNWLYGWAPQMAPNITGQPANVTVSHGQSTNFSVSATGIPDPTYQWYQNGLPIPGATGANYSIASAVRTNGGNYTVAVNNGSGSVTSVVATLTYSDTAPVASAATYSRPAGYPLIITIAGDLSTYWSDVDGDPLALTGAISSTNGASVSYDSSYVYYTNANDVADEIDYTVGDGFGGNTPGIINILVGPPPTNSVAGVVVNGDGSVTLSFVGVANYTYQVDATTNLTPPVVWTTISTNIADLSGQWQITDLQATNYPNQFYRSVYRP